jgi:peptidoglycan/xylan/chitin deacetylase (PgdA/CDA1 family)
VRFAVRRRVTIVNYHRPSPRVFECHLRAFARHYNLISLDQAVAAIALGNFAGLPKRAMVVTIDDGRFEIGRLAPVIAKRRVPVIVYVVAGIVNSQRRLWWSVVSNRAGVEHLKEVPDSERRAALQTDYGHTDAREYESGDGLSTQSLECLLRSGAAVGAHTAWHPVLPKCTGEVALRELQEGRSILERLTGRPVKHFAYPNGAWDSRIRQFVADSGHASARTTDPGWATVDSDPLALPCFGIADDASVSKALIQASGLWSLAKNIARHLARIGTARSNMAGSKKHEHPAATRVLSA